MTQNRTTIKILGSIDSVKSTAQKIESLFPLYIEGPIRMNDDGEGCHIFITLPAKSETQLPLEATIHEHF